MWEGVKQGVKSVQPVLVVPIFDGVGKHFIKLGKPSSPPSSLLLVVRLPGKHILVMCHNLRSQPENQIFMKCSFLVDAAGRAGSRLVQVPD